MRSPSMTDSRPHLLIFSAYPPNRGRLSEYAFQLSKALASMGVRVIVLSDAGPKEGGRDDCGAVEVVECWKPDNPLSLLRALLHIMRRRAPVVLFNLHFAVFGRSRVTNFLGFLTVLGAALLGRLLHFRTLVLLHNLPEAVKTDYFDLKPSLSNRVGLLLAEAMALRCDSVVVTTKLYKKMIEHRFHRQANFVPHGAWAWMPEDGVQISKRDSLLFLGYMSPAKDMATLSRVYRDLKVKHPWLKLKLITSPHPNFPDSMKQLKEFSGMEGVEHLGYKREEELPRILRSCVALVLPYATSTGSSGVLHLVSASGLPAVVSDLAEFRESLYDGAGIVLCRDGEEMVQAIDRLITDEGFWLNLSRRSRAFGDERSWQRVASELLKVIQGPPSTDQAGTRPN